MQRQRVMVITEFDAGDPEATMHAMAAEILRYRHCMRQLTDAIGWTSTGAPFGLIRPGPRWRLRHSFVPLSPSPIDAFRRICHRC